MCGRYIMYSDEDIAEIYAMLRGVFERQERQVDTGWSFGNEVRPTNAAPILYAAGATSESGLTLTEMRWGFPQYHKAGVIINARSETALEKPMFKKSLLQRRCVAVAAAYLEWSGPNKAKVRHEISFPNAEPLFLAGCYNTFTNQEGLPEQRYLILTTEANRSVAAVHDRMPVVLHKEELEEWFFGESFTQLFNREEVELRFTGDAQLKL